MSKNATGTNTADQSMFYEDGYDLAQESLDCAYCGGSGVDSWEGFGPCEECDGEGYRWWE